MSLQAIKEYQQEVEKIICYGGSKNETAIRNAFAEKFNAYRFADYKDRVIDLIKRVTTVSVETMRIIREMENE
jgi:hypothetical protein